MNKQMTFGQAIEAMKLGLSVCRQGWNGRGMFLYLVPSSTVPFEELRSHAKEAAKKANILEGNLDHKPSARIISGHIDMKAADGSIVVGWLASQTDVLATDWMIFHAEPLAKSDFPRRLILEHNTGVELSIWIAIQAVEGAGADVRLTNAVNLLQEAKNLVGDYLDDHLTSK